MKFQCKVVKVFPEQVITKGSKKYKKQDVLVDQLNSKYGNQVLMSIWNDDITEFDLQEGQELVAHIDVTSRKYKDKYYTAVKCWGVSKPNLDNASSAKTATSHSESEPFEKCPF